MTNLIRAIIPESIKKPLKQFLGIPLTRLHSDWQILAPIGPVYKTHIVFDIGAHHGWFFHCWQDWCPEARIHAFEPVQEAYDITIKLYGKHPLVKINQIGIGNTEGSMDLYILEKSGVSNSFLPPRKETWDEIQYETGQVTQRAAPVTTIDMYCKQNEISSIYLMKIDVQGFELKVLEGATTMLQTTDYIFIEAGIVPLYEGAPRFTDVYNFIADRGFHLMAMRAWHRGNNKLVETDMLFRRNDLLPPIDQRIERIFEHIG
jgi:FkbM family methyltransferase